MAERIHKIPGPDHPITIVQSSARVVVWVNGAKIADSSETLTVREANYPPVAYVPRKDVDMSLLERTDHQTYCPYKGDASYFSIALGGTRSKNAVWSYEQPYGEVVELKDYVAFYPDRVDRIDIS